jgi:hypothetical protein
MDGLADGPIWKIGFNSEADGCGSIGPIFDLVAFGGDNNGSSEVD